MARVAGQDDWFLVKREPSHWRTSVSVESVDDVGISSSQLGAADCDRVALDNGVAVDDASDLERQLQKRTTECRLHARRDRRRG